MASAPSPSNPSQIGQLSTEAKKKILDFVVAKWGKGNPQGLPVCEVCRTKALWDIGNQMVSPVSLNGGTFDLSGLIHPFVPIMCTNCGNTHFINALAAGLISTNPSTDPSDENATSGTSGTPNG